ncbi:MAG: hypothetical protein KF862_21045 [Chitinophagaceae bacterium]|nr:hypothetical protein [Chitinophagaceae bacterium]
MRIVFLGIMTVVYMPYSISQTIANADLKLDTLETYNVTLEAHYGGEAAHYFVNGEEVEKRIYDRYRIPWQNFTKCKPCVLKTYDVNNVLVSISTQYQDCGVGKYTAFYPDGSVKVKGQYRQNNTGNWNNLYTKGYCSVMEGDWFYYSALGHLLKIDTYEDGKLVHTKK